MDGFKSTPKMKSDLPCFKAGGYVSRKEFKKEESKDIAADKQMVKMGVSQHESVLHKGEPKTELTLKKGGRAKKSVGTVNKYKAGGSVASESKKPSGDAVSLIKVKPTGDKHADAPNAATKGPAFKGSDVAKEAGKPVGEKDFIKKVKPTGDKVAAAPSGAKGPDAYKKGGKIAKKAMGGPLGGLGQGAISDLEKRRQLEKMARAKKYLGPAQQGELISQSPAAAGLTPPAPAPVPAPAAMPPVNPMGDATGTPPPPMKKGGKAKKGC